MVSLQLSSILQVRLIHRHCRSSRSQQRPWLQSVSCKFSNSHGPVRYTPKSTKLPKNASVGTHTKSHQHDGEATDMHKRFYDRHLAEPLPLNGGHTKLDRKTQSKDVSPLDEEDDLSIKSANVPRIYEPRGNRTYDKKHTAQWRDEAPRYSQKSSGYLSEFPKCTKMQQTFNTEAVSNAGLAENELNSVGEKVETKEKNPFAFMESNAESKLCLQSVKSIPSLPFSCKNPVSMEFNFQPPTDAESFLLKVQRAKQRSRELLSKSHDANFVDGSHCDNDNDRDDTSEDDKRLYLGQDTLDDGAVGNFKDAVSNSTAAREHAKNQAIRYLAMRPYTASQLRKKLESQNITSELADYALTAVQQCGLQSDLVFAETFSRARFNHRSWGPQRIKLGLRERGISNEIIQAAIASVFCEEEIDSEQYGRLDNDKDSNLAKMSRAAMDHLLVQATKQWNRGRNTTNETKIRRMVSWLQYRGFKYDVIKTVLQHLQKGIRIEDE